MNAPKLGDKEAWKPLIAQGIDVLVAHTIDSDNHPKHGDCNQCSTADILEAVKYMVNQSKTDGNYSLW